MTGEPLEEICRTWMGEVDRLPSDIRDGLQAMRGQVQYLLNVSWTLRRIIMAYQQTHGGQPTLEELHWIAGATDIIERTETLDDWRNAVG